MSQHPPTQRPKRCYINGCKEDPFGYVCDDESSGVDWYCIGHFKKFTDFSDTDGGDLIIG